MTNPEQWKLTQEFLRQSNLIEDEPSEEALLDATLAYVHAAALEYVRPFDVRVIHHTLMHRLLPSEAGRYRECPVFIGGRQAPDYATVPGDVDSWCNALNDTLTGAKPVQSAERLEQLAKELHVEFERIHPFIDGNGRTGRILWQWHRVRLGLPFKVIFAKDRQQYYDWFPKAPAIKYW